ncbi:MAG TPA: MTAP family purine nucleoside phosphorylase [Methanocorpusculum sp.]|nr:MTAP family purine nucleoside phosphorylase [Methanocorpusculum sp.]HJJ40095.1 MTAP family purine nucleoside phosphorylase [Methanocorpusculum sp.]HJJ49006.1 MTAP family purine nucleoside phosphorylase [Methanocorpusculum sp.]HJJ57250.1 MTAP family purine nucleoside phosphorylase [Methanocorpusculum sp.]
MLGIIGGTALLKADLPPLKKTTVATPFGTAEVLAGDIAVLKRHQHNTPPASVNHRANLAALKILGVDKLIIIASVGGMKPEHPPGTIAVASGYFSPWAIPTLHEHDIYHVPASLDEDLAANLLELIPDAHRGVYFQSKGPRFETRSEIAHFAEHADYVGMTAASEAALANELGIPVAILCTVDNYANGIEGAGGPTYEGILDSAKNNGERLTELITEIVKRLA